jgi:glycosyltransferase involved in cell wall biosynthesis
VLESLGAGVPVITSRFNGAAELMTPGREGVVLDDPRDAAATARALAAVLGLRWGDFHRRAGELGGRCDFQIHLDRMEDLLTRCASGSRRRNDSGP